MAEEVKVIIGADASQLTTEFNKANESIKKFGSNVQNSSSRAMQSLNDVSRIVQDLPYGFIGISNNINPLVESFGRLKQETKDTGGAMPALAAALSGPAGIGLAFGVVSAAISFSVTGLSRWIKTTKDSTDAADGFNQTLIRSNQVIRDVKDSFEAFNYSQDTALKLWSTFAELTLGKGPAADVQKASMEYVTLADKVQKAKDDFAELKINLDNASKAFFNFQQQQKASISFWDDASISDFDKKLKSLLNRYKDLEKIPESAIVGVTEEQKFALVSYINAWKEYIAKRDEISKLEDDLSQKALANQVLNKEAVKKTNDAYKKTGETIDEIIAKFRLKLSADEAKFLPPLEEIRAKISDYESVIEKLIVEKKVKLTFPKLIEIQNELKALRELEKQIEDQAKPIKLKLQIDPIGPGLLESDKQIMKLYEALGKFKRDIKAEEFKLLPSEEVTKNQISAYRAFIETAIKDFKLSENSPLVQSLQEELAALLGKATEGLNLKELEVLTNATADTFALIGESIGTAISGQGDGIKNAFDGLFMIFGDALVQLGKYAILQSKLMLKLKLAISAGSFTGGVASGIALIALGTLIKTTLSGINSKAGFATGTTFAPGGMALVGERGPELVSLPQGSKVIPNGKTNSMMQGALQAVEVYGTLRGQDIYFSNKKYGLTYNRQT